MLVIRFGVVHVRGAVAAVRVAFDQLQTVGIGGATFDVLLVWRTEGPPGAAGVERAPGFAAVDFIAETASAATDGEAVGAFEGVFHFFVSFLVILGLFLSDQESHMIKSKQIKNSCFNPGDRSGRRSANAEMQVEMEIKKEGRISESEFQTNDLGNFAEHGWMAWIGGGLALQEAIPFGHLSRLKKVRNFRRCIFPRD